MTVSRLPADLPLDRSWEWPHADPPTRLAHLIQSGDPAGCQVALLGLPDDLGVRLNSGRPGAAEGPRAFREALLRYGTAEPEDFRWPGVFDAGDVVPSGTLQETHDRVTQVTDALLGLGLLPVGIGGGHDLTFPLVRALARRAEKPLTGIYLDAHLDVRPEEGSGMSFRKLVEECGVRRLEVRGLDRFSNSGEHLAWFRDHGGSDVGFGPDDPWPSDPLFFSLDLDVVDQAAAPGVSAMNPVGWSPERTARWARAAGRNPRVGCFDLMELSPPHDEGERTARLAARLFLAFLEGFAHRNQEESG